MVRSGFFIGVVSVLLLLVPALDSRREQEEKDHLHRVKSSEMDTPSVCVLSCTAQTYRHLLDRGDTRTVRFHPVTTGELGEHCWSTQVKFGLGVRLQNAYVVLPVDVAHAGMADFTLQPTLPSQLSRLKPHIGRTAVSDECGLQFDVTGSYISSKNQSMFCIKVVPQEKSLVRDLRCPPFLVTVWLK